MGLKGHSLRDLAAITPQAGAGLSQEISIKFLEFYFMHDGVIN